MGNFLYTIALILFFVWAVSFIGYHQNGVIHILLIVAIIAVIYNLVRGTNRIK